MLRTLMQGGEGPPGGWQTGHPLTGIRLATTRPQEELLDRAVEVLEADERILAAWVAGSFASGRADPFSDVDVHCCVTDESMGAYQGDGWKDVLRRITPTVMATTFPHGSIGGYALTPTWTHIDVVFHRMSELQLEPRLAVRPLFDRTGTLLPPAPLPASPDEGAPYFPAAVVDLYFYFFGNLVTCVGRNEPLLVNNGVVTLRDVCLTPLFYAERGVRHRGGAKRVRPFLSEEQYRLLESIPPIDSTLDTCIEANLAIARIFIPRGRALAERTGATWPADLEAATVRYVEWGLGIDAGIP